MNKNSQTPIGDLSGRETELGVPTPAMVEQRAREIARLNERNPHEFTDADWEQARAELTGTQSRGQPDDSSERDSIPGESGREIPRVSPKDEALIDERLASRGGRGSGARPNGGSGEMRPGAGRLKRCARSQTR